MKGNKLPTLQYFETFTFSTSRFYGWGFQLLYICWQINSRKFPISNGRAFLGFNWQWDQDEKGLTYKYRIDFLFTMWKFEKFISKPTTKCIQCYKYFEHEPLIYKYKSDKFCSQKCIDNEIKENEY